MRCGRLLVFASGIALLVACGRASDDEKPLSVPLSAQDSAATAREIQASLSGDVAPGKQTYSFRGLYAGMPQARLEEHVRRSEAMSSCHAVEKSPTDVTCTYDAVLGSDSAHVSVEAQYGAVDARGDRAAFTIIATRVLPLDVDGVPLARAMSDAFEAQTALLDKRDASYGHQQAQVRMGTANGARQNFVDLAVTSRAGRELLTVRLSRSRTAVLRR